MNLSFEDLHIRRNDNEKTRSYDTRYIAEIQHSGLGTYRIFKDLDVLRLENKVDAQFNKWDEQWAKIVAKNKLLADKEASLSNALEQTREAQEKQQQIESLLITSLNIKHALNWEHLKNKKQFTSPNPANELGAALNKIPAPVEPVYKKLPMEPDKSLFEPKLTTFDKLFKSSRERKIEEANLYYRQAIKTWENSTAEINEYNNKLKASYQEQINSFESEKEKVNLHYKDLGKKWETEKDQYLCKRKEFNEAIDKSRSEYLSKKPDAIHQYCEAILNNSQYPDEFPKDFDLDYNAESRLLIVEYVLPSPDDFPTLTEVKYIAAKKETKETHLSKTQVAAIYDTSIYKITLRVLGFVA
jgi:restriction system protein